jgi:hypothetical protein
MRRLDAHHHARIALRHPGGGFAIHVGQHAGAGAVYDPVFKIFKIAPAGAARIHHGGDAAAEGEAVRRNAEVTGIGALLAGAVIDMDMQVDQAGRHHHAAHIDGLDRIAG